MSDNEQQQTTQSGVIREAAELLLELSGADLLPEEYSNQAEALGNELASIADEWAD
jgi:hypothetical protein